MKATWGELWPVIGLSTPTETDAIGEDHSAVPAQVWRMLRKVEYATKNLSSASAFRDGSFSNSAVTFVKNACANLSDAVVTGLRLMSSYGDAGERTGCVSFFPLFATPDVLMRPLRGPLTEMHEYWSGDDIENFRYSLEIFVVRAVQLLENLVALVGGGGDALPYIAAARK